MKDDYREGFALECAGLQRIREEIGLANRDDLVLPDLDEADQVLTACTVSFDAATDSRST